MYVIINYNTFRLKEMLAISFSKHHQQLFCEGLFYSDVMVLLNSKPSLYAKSIVGVIHSGTTSANTVINILHLILQDCIYVPISICDMKICNEIVVSIEQFSFTKNSYPEHLPIHKRQRTMENFCFPCLETLIKHCLYCASWVHLAKKLSHCHIDFCLVEETSIINLPCLQSTENLLVTINVSKPSCVHFTKKRSLSVPLDDLAYIFTSSGTTGEPKSVAVPQSSIVPNIVHFYEVLQLNTSDKVLSCSPLTFDPSIIEIFLTILAGASFVFVDGNITNHKTLCKHMSEATVIMCTPSLIRLIPEPIRFKILMQSSVRILALGGEMFPLSLVNECFSMISASKLPSKKFRLFNFYGITEQSCWSFIHEFTKNDVNLENVPLGQPVPGTKYCVRCDELFLGGERRCFIDEKLAPEWYGTGDQVLVENGRLFISGRINKDQVKINGKKVCRLVIQRAIKQYFNLESHVKFTDDQTYLFIFSDLDLPECTVRLELKKVLPPHYKFDRIVVTSDEMPVTLHHKIDEKKLHCKVVTLEVTRTNFNNTIQEFLSARGYLHNSYASCQILINLGLDSLDVMQLSNYLLDIFPSLALSTDADALYHTLSISPLNKLWETLPKQVSSTNSQVLPKYDANKITVVSRANLTLCVDSSPVVFHTAAGLVRYCVGSHSGVLYCGTLPESTEVWRRELPDRIESSPCYLLSCVYVGCYDGCIYVVSSETGLVEYCVKTDDQVKCSPSADRDSVYCGSHDGKLYKVAPVFNQGATKFLAKHVEIDIKPISASVLLLSSMLVVCTLSGKVAALNKNLEPLFSHQFKIPIFSSPASLADESAIIVAFVTGEILKLSSEDFTVVQKITTGGLVYSNVLLHDSKFYLASHDCLLCCYPTSLTEPLKWSCTTAHKVSSSPTLVQNSVILLTSSGGVVCVVDANTGHCRSSLLLPGPCFSSPAVSQVGSDIYCVVGCRDNYCYVLKLSI